MQKCVSQEFIILFSKLMYADDMVIFSESVDELNKMLVTVYVYSYCQR